MDNQNDVYLKQVPVVKETLKYTVDDQIVTVVIEHNHRIQRALRKLGFKVAKETTVDLDEYSSFVFLQIDGNRDIYTIGQNLKREFGEDCEPLYERLVMFIDFLEDDRTWILFKHKIR